GRGQQQQNKRQIFHGDGPGDCVCGLGGADWPLEPVAARPTRFITSLVVAAWTLVIMPPGAMFLSSPPGLIDRYWDPRKPAWLIRSEESVGSLMSLRMLICTVTRKLVGSSTMSVTLPTLMPEMRTSVPNPRPSTLGRRASTS